MDNKIKYVDLNGLKVFAESLKQDLKNHVIELGLYQELLHRIENLELYKIVDSLPEIGDENTIYLLKNPSGSGDKNIFIEYLYNNEHGWEEIGNFTPSFDLEDYLKIENASFEKGDAENSAVLKGGNNQVISEGGVALGADNLVGLKGFYYKYITLKAGGQTRLANVYLSKTQVSNPTIDTNSGASFKDTSIKPQNYWAVGDIISIVNDAKYDDIATIKQVKDGLVQIEWLDGKSPFSTVKQESDLSSEDYSIYCLDKPTQGISNLGKYSFATGTDNKAINAYTEVSGKGNVVKGKFGKVWGKNNIGGYNTTTFGSGNTNLADNSLVNGTNNINEGNNSVIHGNKNKNYGKRAFVVGNENITNNENEAAFGQYNKSNPDTKFSIGIGSNVNSRKNAFEVKENGDIYIEGFEKPVQTELTELSAGVNELGEAFVGNSTIIDSKLTELSAEIGKKVGADKIATINGKSLINGGNIVIEGGSGEADSPVGYGDAEHSAILKGEYQGYSNKAISQTSMAVGAATTAGLKGWHYSAIDFTNNKITLSDRPTYILADSTLLNGGWSSGVPNIKVDDVISLVNDSKYDLCSKVIAVNDNVITVDSLPFVYLASDAGAAAAVLAGQFSDGYSVYIPDRPDAGIIDFGGGAFSEGGQSKASNICAHAEGLQTHAYGQYSHTEGRETKAGYIAHAEGSKTKAIGNASHAEGTNTQALNSNTHVEGYNTEAKGYAGHAEGYYTKVLANYGHAEGYYTKALGIASHVEGYGESVNNPNLAQGNYSHVEGEKTKALGIAAHSEGGGTVATGNFSHSEGRFTRAHGLWSHVEGGGVEGDEDNYGAFGPISHCEGYATKTYSSANSAHVEGRFTEANNMAEHACGIYNKSTKSSDASQATHFSIGIGASDTDRKNAFEVKQNGDIYIEGVKGRIQDKLNGGSSATPDWNAQENEAGYIKNKPFYTKRDIRQINVDGEYTIVVGEFNIGDRIDISWDLTYYNDEIFRGSTSFVIQEDGEEPTYYYQENDFYIYGGKTFEMYAYNGVDSHYGKVTYIVNGEIKTLEEKYIPDTIARKSDIPVPIIINYNTIKDAANSEVNTISEQTWLKYIANDTYKNYDWIIQRDGIKYNCTVIPDYDNKHIQILYFTRNEIEGTSGPLGNAIMKYSGLRIKLLPYTENTYLIYKISNGGSLEMREFVFGEDYNKNAYLIAAAQMSGIDTIDCKWVYTTKADKTITVNGQYFNIENSITNVDAIFSVKDKSLTYVDGNGLINKVTFADNGSYDISKNNPDIPDTVLKTTPQPLSDENKNQALSNLGIDPIVWKYLCNPCVIKNGEQVPEDLLGNQDTFKYTNRGMYIVYDEGSGSTYTIEKVTSKEIYLYAGGYVAIIDGCWEFN